MRSGRLRSYLTVEVASDEADDLGQPVKSWNLFCTAWGTITDLRGSDSWASQQAQSDVTAQIEIRYRQDLVDLLRLDLEKVHIQTGGRILWVRAFFDPDEKTKRLMLFVREAL